MTSSSPALESGGRVLQHATAGLPPLLLTAGLVVAWQVATAAFGIDRYILPSPVDVGHQLTQVPTLPGAIWATLRLTLTGYAVGVGVGVVVAVGLHLLPPVSRAVYPLLVVSQNIPTLVLAPLLVMWFGFGALPKILLITLWIFFPIAVSTLTGLRSVDVAQRRYLAMAGASQWQIFTKLELPSSLPSLFSGLKIATAWSVSGAVVAEWMGGSNGIGYFLQLQGSTFRVDRMFVGVAAIVVLSLVLFGLVVLAERKVVFWRPTP